MDRYGHGLDDQLASHPFGMSARGLLGVAGDGIAAEHGWGGVAEEKLDVYLAGLLFDGPGGSASTGSSCRRRRLSRPRRFERW